MSASVRSVLLGLLLGLGCGVATSLLQARLDFPWLGLVNAAAPWLTVSFVAGALQRRLPVAVAVGLGASLLELVGYYVTADLRGFGISSSTVAMWVVCALVGGPVFGAAGWAWRYPARWWTGLGGALLVAAWASEAVLGYGVRLDQPSTMTLFLVVAAVLAAALGAHRRQWVRLALWLVPAFALGALGQLALEVVAG